jgi:hypothetical protein
MRDYIEGLLGFLRPWRIKRREPVTIALACKVCGETRTFSRTYTAGGEVGVRYTVRYFICKHPRKESVTSS